MSRRWPIALFGLFLSTFALLALSGPGRIDIIDGQARYEVSRSLVEHDDVVIRDPNVWYPVMPGRNGELYAHYRLPHSLLGVPAILAADATGLKSEARRHFFFALISAGAGAACVVAFAVWFSNHGASPRGAIGWAVLGLLATPLWFYSTSTFDDVLGSAFVLWALVGGAKSRLRDSLGWAAVAGLSIGTAINCKQPLGLFILPVLAATLEKSAFDRRALLRVGLIVAGAAIGVLAYLAFERYKFPPGTAWPQIKYAPPVWHSSVVLAAVVLTVSPAAGMIWYVPAVALSAAGYVDDRRNHGRFAASALVACIAFFLFICCLGFFKGDIGWGPRYLTPMIAVLWLFAPAGARRLGRGRAMILFLLSIFVQVLSLAHDPHRLYIRNQYPPIVNILEPKNYFDLRSSHLFYRPMELAESLMQSAPAEQFSPAPSPTYALPLPEDMVREPGAIARYQVFHAPRPWWACQWFLGPDERPVNLHNALGLLATLLASGGLILLMSLRDCDGRIGCATMGID